MSMLRTIQKTTAGMRSRLGLMVGRAVLKALDDGRGRQFGQFGILADEVRDQVERVQNYGFTSVPLPGSQAVILCVGGNRDHPVAIAVDDPRCRLYGLEAGEVAIYTDEGDYIKLKRGNEIHIRAATKMVIDCPRVEITGDLIDQTQGGNTKTVQQMRDIYDGHTHAESIGSVTATPNPQMGA